MKPCFHHDLPFAYCKNFDFIIIFTEARLEVEWIVGDITNIKSISKALENVDVVIHSAAMVDFLEEADKDLVWKVNVDGNFDLFFFFFFLEAITFAISCIFLKITAFVINLTDMMILKLEKVACVSKSRSKCRLAQVISVEFIFADSNEYSVGRIL